MRLRIRCTISNMVFGVIFDSRSYENIIREEAFTKTFNAYKNIKNNTLIDTNEDRVNFHEDEEQEDKNVFVKYEKNEIKDKEVYEDYGALEMDEEVDWEVLMMKKNIEKDLSELQKESKLKLQLSSKKKRRIATKWQDFKFKKITSIIVRIITLS